MRRALRKGMIVMAVSKKKAVKTAKSSATPVTERKTAVKKAVKTAVKKTAKPAAKKTAASDDKKNVIYLVNIRIAAEDKIRLQKTAAKAGQTFQKFAAEAMQNRYDGNAPAKKIVRKRNNDLDAVITCRMTAAQKRKVKTAAKAANTSISAYILETVFGQY